jgi:hypothetical protein
LETNEEILQAYIAKWAGEYGPHRRVIVTFCVPIPDDADAIGVIGDILTQCPIPKLIGWKIGDEAWEVEDEEEWD